MPLTWPEAKKAPEAEQARQETLLECPVRKLCVCL